MAQGSPLPRMRARSRSRAAPFARRGFGLEDPVGIAPRLAPAAADEKTGGPLYGPPVKYA